MGDKDTSDRRERTARINQRDRSAQMIAKSYGKGDGYDGNITLFSTYKKLILTAITGSGHMKYMQAPRAALIDTLTKHILGDDTPTTTPATPATSAAELLTDEERSNRRHTLHAHDFASYTPPHTTDDTLKKKHIALALALEALDEELNGLSMFLLSTLNTALRFEYTTSHDLHDPYTLWIALSKRFNAGDTNTIASVLRQMISIQQKNESIHQYSIIFNEFYRALKESGDDDPLAGIVKHFFMESVSSSYRQFIQLLYIQKDKHNKAFTFDAVVQQLIEVEARLTLDDHATRSPTAIAHAAAHDAHRHASAHDERRLSGTHQDAYRHSPTHQDAHRHSDSLHDPDHHSQQQYNGHSNRSTLTCFRCGEKGHFASHCSIPHDTQCNKCHAHGHTAKACNINKTSSSSTHGGPARPPRAYQRNAHCTFCRANGHTITECQIKQRVDAYDKMEATAQGDSQ